MRQAISYHIQQHEKSVRKSTGSFYTPDYLADLITREVLFAWLSNKGERRIRHLRDLSLVECEVRKSLLSELREISILDPSVGEGAFLLAAANLITKLRMELGDNEKEKLRRHQIVTGNLFGVDLNGTAAELCKARLQEWCNDSVNSNDVNIRIGNSLVGELNNKPSGLRRADNYSFNWKEEFPRVFSPGFPGFSIVIGNPPYGSILSMSERMFISKFYSFNVGGGRTGTWNSAAHFIVRSIDLLEDNGHLGFLIPNSILRVKQFSKTREFLLNSSSLLKIVDEGSPFDDVTLEMVSIFCRKDSSNPNQEIRVESRRPGLYQFNRVPLSVLKSSQVFSIYHDHIFGKILEKGQKHLLVAGRGRDIPKAHTRKTAESPFLVPYITSGRSVRRYHINPQFVSFTDDWFLKDSALRESFENEFLVATKNYRFPRCILKPKGVVHGGGIVRITPKYPNAELRTLGLILNSKLVRQICIRYLTNYSQLTCCLNTGIMEELPIVIPKNSLVYSTLFDSLTLLYSDVEWYKREDCKFLIECLSDALVYSLYFRNDDYLEKLVDNQLPRKVDSSFNPEDLCNIIDEPEIQKSIDDVFSEPMVREIEQIADFPSLDK